MIEQIEKVGQFFGLTWLIFAGLVTFVVFYWDKKYSQKLCHLQTEKTHDDDAKWPAKSPVSNSWGTVRLYLNNLAPALMSIDCHKLPGRINAFATYSRAHLRGTTWVPTNHLWECQLSLSWTLM